MRPVLNCSQAEPPEDNADPEQQCQPPPIEPCVLAARLPQAQQAIPALPVAREVVPVNSDRFVNLTEKKFPKNLDIMGQRSPVAPPGVMSLQHQCRRRRIDLAPAPRARKWPPGCLMAVLSQILGGL